MLHLRTISLIALLSMSTHYAAATQADSVAHVPQEQLASLPSVQEVKNLVRLIIQNMRNNEEEQRIDEMVTQLLGTMIAHEDAPNVGPRGPRGARGPKGDKGDTGATGATGAAGDNIMHAQYASTMHYTSGGVTFTYEPHIFSEPPVVAITVESAEQPEALFNFYVVDNSSTHALIRVQQKTINGIQEANDNVIVHLIATVRTPMMHAS